ncbi:copper chaperone PCu(A)C [Sphingomicrobium aestuariivivum]|uniref:copper chaperone PCu(A)C n=1 Tax=Sphingomicrobium aestuariivivum TaxID=1582356 RepID=UPI001FD686C6|nr:copper chaperone PCu(A)C [Sphingomicrobium aestuariivivum]MCJ8191716.1 copper chaperone PCu(A)C [Sphingomicrobium aestuariivivum]
MNKLLLSALAGLALAACSNPAPDIAIDDAWARATAAGQPNGAAYMEIANNGTGDDRLVSVATERGMASLHRTSFEDGMASMTSLDDGLAIPAGETTLLQPQGDHVMLMGLETPLVAGEQFDLTLGFERSGERVIAVSVVEAGAR